MKTKTLHQKLVEIQKGLEVPKGQYNTLGGFKYRSCEDILNAVKPLLGECTLRINDKIVLIGERYYVQATVTFSNDTTSIDSVAYAREAVIIKGMDESQITGATSSYARKYALNGLFAIDDTKDADTMDNTKKNVATDPTDNWGASDEPYEPQAPATMCDIHNVPFKEFSKDGKSWKSHRNDDGTWCNYKLQPKASPEAN